MDNQNLGQGLSALIPPKNQNQNNSLSNQPLPDSYYKSALEERINEKINGAVSNFSEELKELEKIPLKEKTKEISNISFDFKEDKIFQIEVEKIKPNPYQPRKESSDGSIRELADSIREHGILEPLIAVRIEKETEKGTEVEYQLIAGERRLIAAKLLGLPTVPVIIKRPMEEHKKLEIALIENIQREDLGLMAKAKAFQQLISEFGLTQQVLAERLGKSREVIANTLRLLQLPFEVQKAIEEGRLNEGHARAILSFSNPEQRRLFYKEVLVKNLSGREAQELAQKYLMINKDSNSQARRKSVSLDPLDLERRERLEEYLDTPVFIKKKGDRGALEIKFFSENELEKLLEKIIKI